MRSTSFVVKNNAPHYKSLVIEPLGLKYGMDSNDEFRIKIEYDSEFELYMSNTDEDIIFEFENFDVDINLTHNNQTITSGYNVRY